LCDRRILIGLGNELRGDDAAGLLVARAARERKLSGVEVLAAGAEPIDLLDVWDGAAAAVVADAIVSGAEPGTIHRFDAVAGPLPSPFAAPSTHALGLAETVELGRALGRLPGRLVVFGLEAGSFATGSAPAPAVLDAIDAVAAAAIAELEGG